MGGGRLGSKIVGGGRLGVKICGRWEMGTPVSPPSYNRSVLGICVLM